MAANDRPNLLLIMSDEHAPMFSGPYGHPLVQTPNLDRLAAEGVVFQNAYCNSPLCTPSRMSFMTGRYVHHIGAWDNSTPLPTDAVTWAHRLRAVGYDVVLSGKQHFYGPGSAARLPGAASPRSARRAPPSHLRLVRGHPGGAAAVGGAGPGRSGHHRGDRGGRPSRGRRARLPTRSSPAPAAVGTQRLLHGTPLPVRRSPALSGTSTPQRR